MSPAYIQALNLIDIEFAGDDPREKEVIKAWRELMDAYSSYKDLQNANERVNEHTATMLESMGKCLGYDFDKVLIKKGAYYPEFHVDIERDQHALRKGILELLDGTGRRKLPIAVFEQSFPDVKLPYNDKSGQ